MEFIKLTHENLEREHICCAISNSKDVQVVSKKHGCRLVWMKDLYFSKGTSEGNALSNISRRSTPGHPLTQRAACSSTVYESRGSSFGYYSCQQIAAL